MSETRWVAGRWWRSHSVRMRLTLWYVAAMVIVLGAYGFGGGSGNSPEQGEGSGGGGGGWSVPLGAYVSRGGDVRFEPNIIGLLIVAIPLISVAGKALKVIIRALKR